MKWRQTYVLKRMQDRDFSKLDKMSNSVVFLYEDEAETYTPDEVSEPEGALEKFLKDFDPDMDLFVLAGPTTLCALAFAMLMQKHKELCVAIFSAGNYRIFSVESLPQVGLSIEKFKEVA